MKLTAKGIELLRSPLGVMLMIPASHNNELAKIDKDTTYSIEIKKKAKNRSLSANSYAWLLMEKIAKELQRKEKALAEAAALLVLRKKADAIWGTEEEDD